VDPDEDERLERAVTAVNLLETTARLMAQTALLVAQTGEDADLERHADFTARCIAEPRQTRALARDLLAVAAAEARRRVGYDERLTRGEFARALELVGAFERRAASHFPAGAVA
jgi:hypothetical protein